MQANSAPKNLQKRKNFFECTERQKYRNKKLIKNQTNQLTNFTNTLGIELNEIILTPVFKKSQTFENVPKVTILPFEISEEKRIFKSLIAKDIANISEKQYIAQRKILKGYQEMPCIDAIIKLKNELNDFFEIRKNKFGYFCSPEQKIKFVCEQFLLKYPCFSSKSFKIKLSLDSTTVTSSNILLLNFSFNLIDDIEMAKNVNGTYMLGSFEIIKEDYEEVKASTKDLTILLENIKQIEIADNFYDIIFYLGCDYKMYRILFGQKASNSLDGCFWCPALMNEVPNENDIGTQKHTLSRKLTDPIDFKEPIFKFIEYNMCILDDLHLLLRVCDRLLNLFLLKSIFLDGNDGIELNRRKNLSVFMEFLESNCKIKNPYILSSKKPQFGKILFRSFNGKELLRIFTELYEPKFDKITKLKIQEPLFLVNLPFPKTDNKVSNFRKEDLLWLGFYKIYLKFQNFPVKTTIDERKVLIKTLNDSLKEWLKDYKFLNKQINYVDKLSPYVHCFSFHYCQMLELHGNIHIFSTNPNEKLNDFCTQNYHRCTNKQNTEKKYLLQLLQKRNRIEFYNLDGQLSDFQFCNQEDETCSDIDI